jgi:cyclophilin family peptidyl-prolyl cis-trans isomerase
VPTADKRQRKKENARMAREAREAELKKRRRLRALRNGGIFTVIFVIGFGILIYFTGRNDKKKVVASPPTTLARATTTTTTTAKAVAYPAGCVATVPKTGAKPQNLKAPAMTIDATKTYTADLSTSCGDVVIALDAKNAPKSVNNFVSLARQGFYDGLKWHRVASDPPIIQGGDPLGTGNGGPGYTTTVELPKDGKYPTGAVAWAKTGTDPDGSAGSQFFIDTGDASGIGDHYGYIGAVTGGQANVQKMGTLAVPNSTTGAPAKPLYIFKVTITEK